MPGNQRSTRRTITLTKAQLTHAAGRELLDLLIEITQDGELTVAEIKKLQAWLVARQDGETVPAVAFLFETVSGVLADGKISREERVEMVLAIERALPKEHRLLAQQHRQEVEALALDSSPPDVKPQIESTPTIYPATGAQLRYIAALGGTAPEDCTINRASQIIENLLGSSESVTRRQRMVLRFWDRAGIAPQGRAAVSDWLDQWYAEDSNRHAAWQLWKEENRGDGRNADPETVRCGIGFEYLERVRAPSARKRSAIGCMLAVATLATIAGLAVAAVAALR